MQKWDFTLKPGRFHHQWELFLNQGDLTIKHCEQWGFHIQWGFHHETMGISSSMSIHHVGSPAATHGHIGKTCPSCFWFSMRSYTFAGQIGKTWEKYQPTSISWNGIGVLFSRFDRIMKLVAMFWVGIVSQLDTLRSVSRFFWRFHDVKTLQAANR